MCSQKQIFMPLLFSMPPLDEFSWEPQMWAPCKPLNETISWCDKGYRWAEFKCKHYPTKRDVDDNLCGNSKPYLVEKCDACPCE